MKTSRIAFLFFLGAALSILVGCSSAGNKESALTDASGESSDVKTVGLGQDDSIDSGEAGSNLKVGEQTYYFDFDKSDIRDADKASLRVQARYLVEHPEAKLLLEGHTDPRGSHEYNIALGERRAKAVQQFLGSEGVASNQIRTVSYGAEKLASSGHNEEDYQQDRRVHLSYEGK